MRANLKVPQFLKIEIYAQRWSRRVCMGDGGSADGLLVEAINQSGALILLGVNLEEIVARGMKWISLRVFSALTSFVI